MNLSVCMIIKNEEKVLERILKQTILFADEIIIVDTGSDDSSKEIARKYTNNIYDFEWCDDFSAARNFSFSKAKCEYIMWLDADDFISEENVERIKQLKNKKTDIDVFMCKYLIAFDENNTPTFEYYRERILKNCDYLKWSGFVHEAVSIKGNIEYLDIEIEHRKIEKDRDVSRNLKIYERHIAKKEVLDARSMFYYARELFYNNKIKKSTIWFKKFLKQKNAFLPNVIDAYLMLSKCYIIEKDLKKAKETLFKSFNFSSPNAEICCTLGEIFLKEKRYKESIFWYKTALNCEIDLKSGAFVQKDYYDFNPYLQLSCAYYYLNDYENFKFYHLKAKQIKPNHSSIVYNEKFLNK